MVRSRLLAPATVNPRIVITVEQTRIIGHIAEEIRNENLNELAVENAPSLQDLIEEMHRVIYRRFAYRDEPREHLEERLHGYVVVRIVANNRTSAGNFEQGDTDVPLFRFDVNRVETILEEMIQSGDLVEVPRVEIMFFWVGAPIIGSGKSFLPDFPIAFNKRCTWTQHKNPAGVPYNCAAFAIAHHVLDPPVKADLKPVYTLTEAIMAKCGWGTYVEQSQFAAFVEHFPSYRITVLMPTLKNHINTTYTGVHYKYEASANNRKLTKTCERNTIYIYWSGTQLHYGLANPVAPYRKSKSYVFCHKCITIKKGFYY